MKHTACAVPLPGVQEDVFFCRRKERRQFRFVFSSISQHQFRQTAFLQESACGLQCHFLWKQYHRALPPFHRTAFEADPAVLQGKVSFPVFPLIIRAFSSQKTRDQVNSRSQEVSGCFRSFVQVRPLALPPGQAFEEFLCRPRQFFR